MKTYSVLYAEGVPHYAEVEIRANNDGAALDLAKKYDFSNESPEAAWDGCVCRRIVHICDDKGQEVGADIPLDSFRLHDLETPCNEGYGIAVGRDDGDCYDIVIKQDDRTIATLVVAEREVQPLVHAGNCHHDLTQALKTLRESIRALPITIMNGPFYDALRAADRALAKAGVA
jgi:hypothetical protein